MKRKVKGYEGFSQFNGVLEISRHMPNASKENSCQNAEPKDNEKTDWLA